VNQKHLLRKSSKPVLFTQFTLFILLLTLLPLFPPPAHAQTPAGRIAFAGYRHGQWDIYSLAPTGAELRQLTNDPFEETNPAYSPDGTKLAFASRRNNNWDVYVLNLQNGEETRLTDSPHYDGAPTWSPDGARLAYESFQNGDLDIWQVPAAGDGEAINLTADSPAGDFAPAWSPAGRHIAFSSWREGNRDLFLLDVAGGEITRLTRTPAAEEWPAWRPDGNQLAFVVDDLGDREVFTLDMSAPAGAKQITWLGRTDGPTWSPIGDSLAAIFHRWDGEVLMTQSLAAAHQLPNQLTDVVAIQGRLTWHEQATNFGQPVDSLADSNPSQLYEETLTPNEGAAVEPYNLIRQNDLVVGSPWLADTVDDSFQAWRARLRAEVGYDFLGKLSDVYRDAGANGDNSQYASWHKSGRAIDMLFDYHVDGELAHEIVRENYGGETFWRIYLRCIDQSGACGRPLTANSWNYSGPARVEIAPEQGGVEKPNLTGYYVDLTALAREYGWSRISSYDDDEYSWTWHFLAFEYWHYEKRLSGEPGSASRIATWYEAMSQVHPPETMERYFTWEEMVDLDEPPHQTGIIKGAPIPLSLKPWWALVKQ
jgi:TolB protein